MEKMFRSVNSAGEDLGSGATNSISSAIKNRSINLPQNSLFSIKDFTALGAYKSVKVILTRFEKEHLIKR